MPTKLTPEQIKELLEPTKPQKIPNRPIALPEGRGPLQYTEKEQRCLNSGYYAIDPKTNQRFYKKTHGRCNSPTHYELEGIPYCVQHCLHRMNEMLIVAAGEEPTEVRDTTDV